MIINHKVTTRELRTDRDRLYHPTIPDKKEKERGWRTTLDKYESSIDDEIKFYENRSEEKFKCILTFSRYKQLSIEQKYTTQ